LPKSFAWAMNAAQVRADYREKRKVREEGFEDVDDGPKKTKRRKLEGAEAQIRPGETLAHFNKRVEMDMRPLVRSAFQTSQATTRAERRKSDSKKASSKSAKPPPATPPLSPPSRNPSPAQRNKLASCPKQFGRTSTAAPRRLNDIALAPPDLSVMVRQPEKSRTKTKTWSSASVLSPAQQLQMGAARGAAIARYREMKAARYAAGGGADGREPARRCAG
ncbi:hypothetical protein DFH09DRAFT_911651, partial [Mycena vulgaris]